MPVKKEKNQRPLWYNCEFSMGQLVHGGTDTLGSWAVGLWGSQHFGGYAWGRWNPYKSGLAIYHTSIFELG